MWAPLIARQLTSRRLFLSVECFVWYDLVFSHKQYKKKRNISLNWIVSNLGGRDAEI